MAKKTKNNFRIGVLGNGEVGQAIANFYDNPLIKDLKKDDGLIGVDILHVCVPYQDNFEEIVAKEISQIKPQLTIIHSTIAPGTTKKLALKFSGMVVHSPVRGTHPYLYKGIKTFVKYIGADNKKAALMAKKHLERLGIKTKIFMPSVTTEIGKVLDTTYYGLCIAWHGEMKKLCDRFKIDFNKAVTDFNITYNEGYKKLGKHNVVRPVLYPSEKGCGGHCVLENTILLRESSNNLSPAFDFILSMGKEINSIAEEKPCLNKTWLHCEYWGKGRSARDIAEESGCSETNILAILKRRNIPRRDFK